MSVTEWMWLSIYYVVYCAGTGAVDILIMMKTGTVHSTGGEDGLMNHVQIIHGTISVRSEVSLNFTDETAA